MLVLLFLVLARYPFSLETPPMPPMLPKRISYSETRLKPIDTSTKPQAPRATPQSKPTRLPVVNAIASSITRNPHGQDTLVAPLSLP